MRKKITTSLMALSLMAQSLGCVAADKPTVSQNFGSVRVRGTLSQTKVLQGSDGLIYLQVDMEGAEKNIRRERKPTDFVVVLDRSGSMGDEKKMNYAHRAINSLINQLQATDRFALVAFDSQVETPIYMTYATTPNKSRFQQIVNQIEPRGGTNLSDGLLQGISQVQASQRDRAQRMILISDGLANEGITDTASIERIAAGAVRDTFAISTIGVGIDFNESLMAGVADHGRGNYYYLEKLAMLDKVLSDEFHKANQIVASDVRIEMELGDGVVLTDASGYPYFQQGRQIVVEPGHVYGGQKKSLFLTFQLPTGSPSLRPLGKVRLTFNADDRKQEVILVGNDVRISCLPGERRQEVLSSIDKNVYEKAWTENNYGKFLKENAAKVSQGDQAGALSTIQVYRDELEKAYQAAPTPGMKQKLEALEPQKTQVQEAFSSSDAATATKKLSKDLQYQGIQKQRSGE